MKRTVRFFVQPYRSQVQIGYSEVSKLDTIGEPQICPKLFSSMKELEHALTVADLPKSLAEYKVHADIEVETRRLRAFGFTR